METAFFGHLESWLLHRYVHVYIEGTLQYNWGCPDKEVTVHKPFHHNYKLVAMSASNNCVCGTDIPNKVADRIP